MDPKEFEIPVPWGHIAAKAWGNDKNPPVLMVHGMGDNAGTFDRLIPHLSKAFHYICIDLPGFGKSSHFPPHVFLHTINYVLTLKIVLDYLNRDDYILVGHSWGGRLSVFFTQLYPERISKLVSIDAIYLWALPLNQFKDSVVSRIDKMIDLSQRRGAPPSYTYDEACAKVMQGRVYGNGLDEEAAKALVDRAVVSVDGDKVRFSGDVRAKAMMGALQDRQFAVSLVRKFPVSCPVLFIKASESVSRLRSYEPIVKEMRRNNGRVFTKVVEGGHDVHNNRPEVVAPVINYFLNDTKSKL